MIIAIVNNKGGTGKTTSALTFAHLLALKKHKVLVVDMDSQCNATSTLGPRIVNFRSVYDLLSDLSPAPGCIYPTEYKNLFVLPNIEDSSALEPSLLGRPGLGYSMLRDLLQDHAEQEYDHTIIDCPPNLGLFSIQSMMCADAVIVPVEAGSKYAVDGLDKTLKAIESIRDTFHPDLRLLRVLITKADMRTTVCRLSVEILRKQFQDLVFDAVITNNTDVKQAEMRRLLLLRHNPRSLAARAYKQALKELLGLIEG
jgi:cellulose biosynthesis protein BcsQ